MHGALFWVPRGGCNRALLLCGRTAFGCSQKTTASSLSTLCARALAAAGCPWHGLQASTVATSGLHAKGPQSVRFCAVKFGFLLASSFHCTHFNLLMVSIDTSTEGQDKHHTHTHLLNSCAFGPLTERCERRPDMIGELTPCEPSPYAEQIPRRGHNKRL
eukprot:960173-Amphidinium_carterae.1